jgi:hypothetical protein
MKGYGVYGFGYKWVLLWKKMLKIVYVAVAIMHGIYNVHITITKKMIVI